MAKINISVTVKDSIKVEEVTKGIKLFDSLVELQEHNTISKAICKAVSDTLHSIACNTTEDTEIISLESPEDTAEYFRNYFEAVENGKSVIKLKGALVSRGTIQGTYVIKKGSIVKTTMSRSVGQASKDKVKNWIDDKILDPKTGVLSQDVEVSSTSMAATIINGTPTSGKQIFAPIIW